MTKTRTMSPVHLPATGPELSELRSPEPGHDGGTDARPDILHLAELVAVVRERLAIEASFPDDAILASLKTVAARSDGRARAVALFNSNLGQHLGRSGGDLQAAMEVVLGLLPPVRS